MSGATNLYSFRAKLYRIGINLVADVPKKITNALHLGKGPIRITGHINKFPFHTTLMPVKGKPYILYVNIPMLKGAEIDEGDTVAFSVQRDHNKYDQRYPMIPSLAATLKKRKLLARFEALTESRKKDILKYLNNIKTASIMEKHIETVCSKLVDDIKDVRIP